LFVYILYLVHENELSKPLSSFNPLYTYQFFGDSQTIKGFKKANVNIYIRDDDFSTYIIEDVEKESENVFYLLIFYIINFRL
jgi:hypothetical protein